MESGPVVAESVPYNESLDGMREVARIRSPGLSDTDLERICDWIDRAYGPGGASMGDEDWIRFYAPTDSNYRAAAGEGLRWER